MHYNSFLLSRANMPACAHAFLCFVQAETASAMDPASTTSTLIISTAVRPPPLPPLPPTAGLSSHEKRSLGCPDRCESDSGEPLCGTQCVEGFAVANALHVCRSDTLVILVAYLYMIR